MLVLGLGSFFVCVCRRPERWFAVRVCALSFDAIGAYMGASSRLPLFREKFHLSEPRPAVRQLADHENGIESARLLEAADKPVGEHLVRINYMQRYVDGITESLGTSLTGHAQPIERTEIPSAHNYYLDFVYNFGLLSIAPLTGLIVYTCALVLKRARRIIESPDLFGLTALVLLLLFVDNNLKVTFRQPYPGVLGFFIWGVLLTRLRNPSAANVAREDSQQASVREAAIIPKPHRRKAAAAVKPRRAIPARSRM
jgi:hypothetical protein